MWLLTRLKNALQAAEAAQTLQVEVRELAGKIEALEAVQLAREVQWTETKDQVLRHLKRVQAVRQHQDADPAAELRNQLIARKFPRTGG